MAELDFATAFEQLTGGNAGAESTEDLDQAEGQSGEAVDEVDSPAGEEPAEGEQVAEEQSVEDQAPEVDTPEEAQGLQEFLQGTPFKEGAALVKAWKEATAAMTPLQQENSTLRAQVQHLTQRQAANASFESLSDEARADYERKAEARGYRWTPEQLYDLDLERRALAEEQSRQGHYAHAAEQVRGRDFYSDEETRAAFHEMVAGAEPVVRLIADTLPPEVGSKFAEAMFTSMGYHAAYMKLKDRLPAMQEAWKQQGVEEAEKRLMGVKRSSSVAGKPGVKPGVKPSRSVPSIRAPRAATEDFADWLSSR
jgi:hypothetical protein